LCLFDFPVERRNNHSFSIKQFQVIDDTWKMTPMQEPRRENNVPDVSYLNFLW